MGLAPVDDAVRAVPVDAGADPGGRPGGRGGAWLLVICSLEPWGDVKRRLQLLPEELLALDPDMRILFVEPAVDVRYQLARGNVSSLRRPPPVAAGPRVQLVRPRKWLPRSLGGLSDRALARAVERHVRRLALGEPVLWVNDSSYAALVQRHRWPSVYDVTDDWAQASGSPRARRRARRDDERLVRHCDAVVVCSPQLAESRGRSRQVDLVPNGVDTAHFRAPRPRPADLPAAPVLVYVGTLHHDRLDVDLCCSLAEGMPDASLVLVGPDALVAADRGRLGARSNVHLLGSRPYRDVPAYLQHADVVVVPHRISPFTESLDPIKAYECLAVGRPTVATPVAGFRQLGPPTTVAEPAGFVEAVRRVLAAADDDSGEPESRAGGAGAAGLPREAATWRQRAEAFADVLTRVRQVSP